MPRPCILFVLPVLAACACTTLKVHTINPFPQRLPDTTACAVLELSDHPPINSDSLGFISYFISGVHGQDYPRTQKALKSAARRAGANLVKLTGYTTYHQGRSAYEHITATLYKVSNIESNEKVIAWNSHRRLTFADFKGRRDSCLSSTLRSYSQYGIVGGLATFVCKKSWIDSTSADAARLLIHEQGNFDLAECYTRQWRTVLYKRYHLGENMSRRVRLANRIEAAYDAKRVEYDLVTDHGLDDARQSEWANRIAHALADSTDHSFLVPTGDPIVQQPLPPPAGKSLVYIVRPKRFTSSIPKRMLLNIFFLYPAPYFLFFNPVKYEVGYSDTLSTGRIPAYQYTYRYLDPGENDFTPWAYVGNWVKYSPELGLLLAPGKTYYLRLDMPSRWFGFHALPKLVLVSDEEGRRLLRKCRPVNPDDEEPAHPDGLF
jgi:hypothetical protein